MFNLTYVIENAIIILVLLKGGFMRKRISKQNKQEKATISLKKIFIITVIFLILAGMMSVMATNQKLTSVKILLSSGYEMDVMTTSSKVPDILAENHIVVLDDESVTPNIDEELSDNRTITITKGAEQANDDISMSAEEILASYTQIVEKVLTEEVEIPFETITKDVSNGSFATQNRVVQNGENGLKRVTYRIRYQSGAEIEKTEIASEVIKEPVDKIVEVRTKQVTSRSGGIVKGSVAEYQAYAEKRCFDYGWSDADFSALVKLWNKESGWNPASRNASSGAYGIPQALPASKMATAGSDYLTNYKTQINWGLSYIKSRYGTPSAAWNHACKKGWY